MNNKIADLKKYALLNKVPIIQDDALDFILKVINSKHEPKLLEIGSAIGYSAICFALNNAIVTTIEKDERSYQIAKDNIASFGLNINIINEDALSESISFDNQFDIIFIDAAKSKYIEYFAKYNEYLSPQGVIICDNLNFHNLDRTMVSKNTRKLLEKLDDFKTFLVNNNQFETQFLNAGDGLSVSKRRK